MRLTNNQITAIVNDIYNTIQTKQQIFIESELNKNLAKKIAEFKKNK